jgi:hypothetical protein
MIVVNIDKAKLIAHNLRRKARETEFIPLDEKIMKQLPGVDVDSVEQARQSIRDRYVLLQTQIDQANTTDEIKLALAGV